MPVGRGGGVNSVEVEGRHLRFHGKIGDCEQSIKLRKLKVSIKERSVISSSRDFFSEVVQ